MTIRRLLAVLASVLMLTAWATPVQARGAPPPAYPSVTSITFTWSPADATGTCHNTTTATLSAPITATTRVSVRWTLTAISPQGAVWAYTMWIGSPPVGATQVPPWTIGACSSDGAKYVSVRIDLFQGTRVTSRSVPYTGLTKELPAYVCTAPS